MSDDLIGVLRRIDAGLSGAEEEREPRWGGFHLIELLRWGAGIGVDPDHGAHELVEPFLVKGHQAVAAHSAEIGDVERFPTPDEITEYELESMVPSASWSAEEQAWFWRVKGKAFWFDYADASLNLTADALGEALPWFTAHTPAEALHLWARRLITRLVASYGAEETLEELDELLALWAKTELDDRGQAALALAVVDVLARIRTVAGLRTARSRKLLEICLWGLDWMDASGETAQRARLLHGLAHAVTYPDEETELEAHREALEARLGASDTDPWTVGIAAAAWERALAEEDGEFVGGVPNQNDRRGATRRRAYDEELVRLELLFGDADAAVTRCVSSLMDDSISVYDLRALVRNRIGAMRDDEVGRAARRDFLLRVADEVLKARLDGELADFEAGLALELFEVLDYHLVETGGGAAAREAMAQLARHPTLAAARARKEKRDAERATATQDAASKLAEAFFKGQKRREPTELEVRLGRVDEANAATIRASHTDLLLFRVRTLATSDASRVKITGLVNVAEAARETLLAEPVVAGVLDAFRGSAADEFRDAEVELAFEFMALGRGLTHERELAIPLTYAGADATLATMELEPQGAELWGDDVARDDFGVPEPVAKLAAELRGREVSLRMSVL